MLGSIQDAEDQVQEVYIRAWRSFDQFEGRSSLRVWMYKIATHVCLTALESKTRRHLPSDLQPPSHESNQLPDATESSVRWLRQIPDSLIAGPGDDLAARHNSRAGIRLAFIAALQTLSARQRAVLILRDVLSMKAVEVAEILDTTTIAVNSALRRVRLNWHRVARRRTRCLSRRIGFSLGRGPIRRCVQRADIDALIDLLRADVVLEMPPIPTWFTGSDAVSGFLRRASC